MDTLALQQESQFDGITLSMEGWNVEVVPAPG